MLLLLAAPAALADETGTIAGCVLDHAGAPAAGAVVHALGSGPVLMAEAGQDGCYTLPEVPAEQVRVTFAPSQDDPDDAPVYYGGMLWTDGIGVVVRPGETTGGIDGRLAHAGSVSGRVTGPGGAPLAGVQVDVMDAAQSTTTQSWATTDADGRYTLRRLTPTPFFVRAWTPEDRYVDSYPPDLDVREAAKPVEVRSGEETSGVDIAMQPAASLSGRVTDPDGTPLPGIEVSLSPGNWSPSYVWTQVKTDADGRYRFPGLHHGWVNLEFRDTTYVRPLLFNRGVGGQGSPPVLVPAGAEVVNDVMMGVGASLSGTLRDVTGRPVSPGAVHLDSVSLVRIAIAPTDAEGRWSISSLPTGRYWTSGELPQGPGLPTRFFDGGTHREGPLILDVKAPQARTGIDLVVLLPGQEPQLDARRAVRAHRRTLTLPLRCPGGCAVDVRAGRATTGHRLATGTAPRRARRVSLRVTRAGTRSLRRRATRATVRVKPRYGEARTFAVRLRR